MNTTERKYKAFISYRHKPLDSEYASKLHKRIEHYVIPASLRENGQKKLGLVFRDLEELPIADDLDENIRRALDHSEYLIVMCSPDTPGSIWVQKEITYFLQHHSRNHVLACLVAGTPDESFPAQLVEVRDENGDLVDRVEPLAANIAADSAKKRNALFRTESLRILASLIGCPYDALYKREQRYRTQRLMIAFGIAAAVAVAFIGLLLNRNARIREQLIATKRNESEMLAYISQIALMEGDYRKAMESALDALPGRDPDRPYVASAESALVDALGLYKHGLEMRYVQSMDQDTEIRVVRISPDQKMLATGDAFGKINLYDMESGDLLWSFQHSHYPRSLDFAGNDLLLVTIAGYDQVCLSVADGSVVWQNKETVIVEVSPETGLLACTASEPGGQYPVRFMDIQTGETVLDLGKMESKYSMLKYAAISPDGNFAALFLPYTAEKRADIWLYDLRTGEGKLIDEGLYYRLLSTDYTLAFGENGILAVAACGDQAFLSELEEWDTAFLKLFGEKEGWECRCTVALDFGTAVRGKNGLIDTSDYMDYMEVGTAGIAMASKNRLVFADAESGRILWSRDLPDYVISGHMYRGDDMCLALANGLVTWCSAANGTLSYDISIGFLKCDFPLQVADSAGDFFLDGISAVVSEKHKGRVSCIDFCDTKGAEPFPFSDKIPEKSRFYYSPSGKRIAAVLNDYDNSIYRISVLDPTGEEEPFEMTGEDRGALSSAQTHIFVTEEGKVIMGGKVCDPAEGTETLLTPGLGEFTSIYNLTDASCKRMADDKIITASVDRGEDGIYKLLLWEDGDLIGESRLPLQPEQGGYDPKFTGCGCVAVGAAGTVVVYVKEDYEGPRQYAVYLNGEDKWFSVPYLDPEKEEVLALGETHHWMAVQQADESIRIYDAAGGGAEIRVLEAVLPAESVTKMMFAEGDKYLVVLNKAGELVIYDTEDGSMLHRSSYGSSNVRFDADARYEVYFLPEKKRMLVVCDDLTYTEPFCISIDLGSFDKNGFYHTIGGYLPLQDRLVSDAFSEELCFYPLYSMEEIVNLE